MLFRRAIQLSVSGKHWAEIIYGWPIEMLSGMNKSRIAINRGTMSYSKSAGQLDISGVFGMAVGASSSVAGSWACFRHTRDHVRVRYRLVAQSVTLCVLAAGG